MDIVLSDAPVVEAETKTVTATKRPQMYHVILLNDDFTPMDFVVKLLEEIFFLTHDESLAVMLEVHHYGKGVAGTYTREVAETKMSEAMEIAELNGHPLKCTIEAANTDNSTD